MIASLDKAIVRYEIIIVLENFNTDVKTTTSHNNLPIYCFSTSLIRHN